MDNDPYFKGYLVKFVEAAALRDSEQFPTHGDTWSRVIFALIKGNQHHQQDRASTAKLAALQIELQDAYDGWRRTLENQPQKNGEYAHLVICSGDRSQPPGTPGVSCCCKIQAR